ncbi:hypothetical protein C8R44DRAFT_741789 [Mycena epipterygia]|nr:hypothetical protein C8R44DRAFT_741789 [Mycena epipterygia]
MPLKHLCCDTSFEPFHHPSFRQITHLELFAGVGGHWTRLVELPQLTHLALNTKREIPVCSLILATLKSLRALLILCPPPPHLRHELAILAKDSRFAMMQFSNYAEDWHTGILTGVDYWARADQFIAKRMSGEIDCRTFFLDER